LCKANKPIILEEYGSPDRHNHSFILRPWQEAVRKSGIAADQIWQFGPANLTADLFAIGDEYSLYFNDTDFEEVGKGHAKKMLDKVVE
jgi:mannan endo-1,4-beta-mannosidase